MANNDADLLRALRALPTATRTRQLGQSQRPAVAPTRRTNGPSLAERFKAAGRTSAASQVGVAQQKLNNYTANKTSEYPTLAERFARAQGGETESTNALGSIGSAILNNPITKVALGALSVVDTPRRAVISTAREITDLLDDDPNTKAGFGDWFEQTKDTAYGFGTAFPMEGGWGRAIGFFGDVGLDPLTYATFGSTIPAKLMVEGVEGVARQSLRSALGGVKNVAGREGRLALANLSKRMGASDELVRQIAMKGKSAFRHGGDEGVRIAKQMGLQQNGIYYLGSRIRVPFSRPIADFIETGLADARVGFLNHVPGAAKLQEMITPSGIQKNMAGTRAGLARGKFAAAEAAEKVKTEAVEYTARSRKKVAEGVFSMKVSKLVEDSDVQQVGSDFYQFLDRPESYIDMDGQRIQLWKREMTPVEVLAKEKYRLFWKELADEVDAAIKVTEPTFEMNRFDDFLPHIRTDEAAKMMEDARSIRAEQIMAHLKFNIADPKGSFQSRNLAVGDEWFGHLLKEEDIRLGVDRLNWMAMHPKDGLEAMKGNFFETDMFKILSKYGDHYSSQIGMAGMFEEAFKQDLMRTRNAAFEFTKDWKSAAGKEVKRTRGRVKVKEEKLREHLAKTTNELRDELRKAKARRVETQGELSAVAGEAGSVADATARLQKMVANLKLAREEHRLAVQAFDGLFDEKNVLVQQIFDQIAQGDIEMERMIQLIDDVSDSIWRQAENAGDTLVHYEGRMLTVDEALTTLDKRAETLAKTLSDAQTQSDFIDQMAEQAMLIMGAGLGDSGSVGNSLIDEMLALADNPASRAHGVPGSKRGAKSGHGGLGELFIRKAMGPNSEFPELKAVLDRINPYGSKALTPRKLNALFLHNYEDKAGNTVRGILYRIANGVTTGTNHEELRQAAAWIIIRDYKYASMTGTRFSDELLLDPATAARHEQLIELLVESDIAATLESQTVINYRTAPKTGDKFSRPLTSREELRDAHMQRAVKYNKHTRALDEALAKETQLEHKFSKLIAPDESNPAEVAAFKAVQDKFIADRRELRKTISRLSAEKQEAKKGLPATHRRIVDQLSEMNSAVDRTAKLAGATAEYFLHREAVIQTSRIAKNLVLIGYKPTPELYRTMVGRVAEDQLKRVEVFTRSYNEAVNALTRLRERVTVPTKNSIGLKQNLREELRRLFDAEELLPDTDDPAKLALNTELMNDRDLVREFFPEIESVWREGNDSRVNVLFHQHEDTRVLVEDLLAEAYKLGVPEEYTQTVIRAAHPVRSPKGPAFTSDGNPIDYSELKGMTARATSTDAAKAQYDNMRGNVERLIHVVEQLDDARIEGRKVGLQQTFDKAEKEARGRLIKQAEVNNREWQRLTERVEHYEQQLVDLDKKKVARERAIITLGPKEQSAYDSRRAAINAELERLTNLRNNSRVEWEQQIEALRQMDAGSIPGPTAQPAVKKIGQRTTHYKDPLGFFIGDEMPEELFDATSDIGKEAARKAALRSNVVQNLRTRFNDIRSDITGIKRKVTKVQKTVKRETRGIVGAVGGEHRGFMDAIDGALDGSDRVVNDLFSELLGGPRTVYNSEFTTKAIVRNKIVNKTRSTRKFREIPANESLTGKAQTRMASHVRAYKMLSSDPAISGEALLNGTLGMRARNGDWIPGVWAFNPDLEGAAGLADSLDEAARELADLAVQQENMSASQGRLATKKAHLERLNNAPEQYTDETLEKAEMANRREALKRAGEIVRPATERLRQLQADPLYARAVTHEAQQQFALELAGLSDQFAINSGLFTPLEWHALWSDGEIAISEFSPGMQGVKQMLSNQLDILHKQRNEFVAGRRPTKAIDIQIAKMEKAQAGLYDLSEFKAQAYEKFGKVYDELGGEKGAVKKLRATTREADKRLADENQDLRSPYALGSTLDKRKAGLRKRYMASPEAKHLTQVYRQQEDISEAMVDHMLREPDTVRRAGMYADAEAGDIANLKAKLTSLNAERKALISARKPLDVVDTEIAKVKQLLSVETANAKVVGEARQRVARAPARDFPKSGPDLKVPFATRKRFQSQAAANIYNKSRKMRQQANETRMKQIEKLEEQLGRGQARQLAHSATVQRAVKRIDEMLNITGHGVKRGDHPFDVVSKARSVSGQLTTDINAYKGIDSRTRRAITKSVIGELGYEPGQFKGQTVEEISKSLNARTKKLLGTSEPTPAKLDAIFEKRVLEEVDTFRKTAPRRTELFEVDEATRGRMSAKQAVELGPDTQKLAQLRDDIMRFKLVKVLSGTNMEMMQEELAGLTASQRTLMAQQFNLGEQLAKAVEKQAMPANVTKRVASREARLLKAEEALGRAGVAFDMVRDFEVWGPAQIKQVELDIAEIEALIKRSGDLDVDRFKITHRDDWLQEANEFINDARGMLRSLAGGEPGMTQETKDIISRMLGAQKEYLMATREMAVAEHDAIVTKLIKGLDPTSLQAYVTNAGLAETGMVDAKLLLDEGFVELSKYFPNIQVRTEVAEMYQNIHRIADPAFARELQKHLGKYTQFFKAYATLSPGFHLRNAMSNTFMAIASGANLVRLARGLKYSHSMLESLKKNGNYEAWILSLPTAEQLMMRNTLEAVAASGGGLIDDFLSEITPIGTRHAKKVGRWIEQHSRFMLAYDGVAGGYTPQQAAARVKRFLIDYQDISSLDATMRQIVPFWMWTSRNLPMQIQNMWLNPRAYQIYNAIKRNLRDDEEGDVVPQWMQEMGAFKLPFGNNLYATPDIGFNRVQQQVNEIANPSKFMANVNPMLRVPLELMGGKKFFSGSEFSPNPVEVSGGISPVLQPLLQALGYGTTAPDGTKFVDDKAYYAIRNLIPFLGASERLVPTAQTGKAGSMNPLLGFLGAPVRENTVDMMLGEIARRKRNVSGIASRQKSMQDAGG